MEPTRQEDPSIAPSDDAAGPADPQPLRGLDPVDLATMLKTQKASATAASTKRYTTLAMVVVVFVVLVVMGLLLASHVHAGGTPTNGALGTVRAVGSLSRG